MEITLDRRLFYGLAALLALVTFAGLALLGRPFTPTPSRVIGWADWSALKTERQYQRELATLRADLAELAALLQATPDPVRAAQAATRVGQHHSAGGLDLLARQREAVVIAAGVVRDWAAGYVAYEDAVATVNEAIVIVGLPPSLIGGQGEVEDHGNPWGAGD